MSEKTYKSIVVAALLTGAVGLGYKLLEPRANAVVNPSPKISAEDRERARLLGSEAATAILADYRRERKIARSLLTAFGADQQTGIPRNGFTLSETENQILYLTTDGQTLHDELPYERVCSTLSSLPAKAYQAARMIVLGQHGTNMLMRAHRWPSERWRPTPEAIHDLTTGVAQRIPRDSAEIETLARFLYNVSQQDSMLNAARSANCLPPDQTIRVPLPK